jgi:Na+/alanine symporter
MEFEHGQHKQEQLRFAASLEVRTNLGIATAQFSVFVHVSHGFNGCRANQISEAVSEGFAACHMTIGLYLTAITTPKQRKTVF